MKIYKINNDTNLQILNDKIRAQNFGLNLMKEKSQMNFIFIDELKRAAANILKQDALSVGAELIASKDSIIGGEQKESALLMATNKQINLLAKKEALQDFGLKDLAKFLEFNFNKPKAPEIMGVLNFNLDSFNANSRIACDDTIKACEKMIDEGADYIDIGAVSSRPGSEYCGKEEEFRRLKPVLDAIYDAKLYEKVKFSLDSYDEFCLTYALERGFSVINDISANTSLCELASKFGAKYVLMHMKGQPKTMQNDVKDSDIIQVVDEFFASKLEDCYKFGVKDVILDVGIGFGKTPKDNFVLLKNLEHFLHFEKELLFGASRKSLINQYFPSEVKDRLAGTLFIHQKAFENGASIIRAHDVYEHKQVFALNKIYNEITL